MRTFRKKGWKGRSGNFKRDEDEKFPNFLVVKSVYRSREEKLIKLKSLLVPVWENAIDSLSFELPPGFM